jgi:parallel beta-helix repeat protein
MSLTSYSEPEFSITRVLGKRAIVYLGILFLALVLLLVVNAGEASAAGPTYVYDDIASDTNWTADDSPYIVNQSISIRPGVTLTIEPNVTVMFDDGVGLTIGGTLDAQGTADEEVFLTSNGSTSWGAWSGLLFNETSTGSVLDHVYIQYAYSPVYITESSVILSNLRISDYNGGGAFSPSGIYWESATDSITASISNVQIWNGSYTGIIFWSEEGDVDLTLTDVTVRNITFGSGLGISANNTLQVSVNNFTTINMGWRGVVLLCEEGGIDADFTRVAMDGLVSDGFMMLSKGATAAFDDVRINDSGGSGVWVNLEINDTGIDLAFADVALTNILNYGVHMNSPSNDISLEMIDVLMENIGSSAIDALCHEGAFAGIMDEVSIVTANYGLYVEANGTIDLSVSDNYLNGLTEDAFYLYTQNSDVELEATTTDILNAYNGFYISAHSGYLWADLDEVYMVTIGWSGFDASVRNDIDLWAVDTTIAEAANMAMKLFTTNGSVMLDLTNFTTSMVSEFGVYAWAPNGDVLMTIDPSCIQADLCGIFVEAEGNASVTMQDTTIRDCDWGILIYGDVEDVVVEMTNCTIDNCESFGVRADANLGDIQFIMTDSILNGTVDGNGISLVSAFGDVVAHFEGTSFTQNWWSVYAETYEADLWLYFNHCTFDGDLESSVTAFAAGDANVEVTSTDIYGGSGMDAWYFAEEIEYEFEVLDPDYYTSGSWYMLALPWEVPFNGVMYDTVYVYRWGYITLGSYLAGPTNFGGSVPIIAPCQGSFNTDNYPMYGHTFYDDRLVFQWDVYVSGENSYLRNVFEVILFDNGDIQFNYAEMESISHGLYDWGINLDSSSRLEMNEFWKVDPFDNDWTSYYFKYVPLSSGWGIYVETEGNCTATIAESSIGGFDYAGAMFISEGWMWSSTTDSSFYDIYGCAGVDLDFMTSIFTGGLMAMSANSTINALVQGCEFTNIVGTGAVFASQPMAGGFDSVSITYNTFVRVSTVSAGTWTYVEDDDGLNPEVYYRAVHEISDNVGVASGSLVAYTDIHSFDSAWNLTVNDIVSDNSFTGEVMRHFWPGGIGAPQTALWVFAMSQTELDGAQVRLTAIVTDNVLSPICGPRYTSDGMWVEHYTQVNDGTMEMNSTIVITDNTLVGDIGGFFYGIFAAACSYLNMGEVEAVADLQVAGNLVENPSLGFSGIYLQTGMLPGMAYGVGNGMFDSNVVVDRNTISGYWTGISIGQYCFSYQHWGDLLADFDTWVVDNIVDASSEGISVFTQSTCSFTDYFPSYEQEIYSSTSINTDLEILDNTVVAGDYGVHVLEIIEAREDGSGTFTNALCTVSEEVVISGNNIESSFYGIRVYSEEVSDSGESRVESSRIVDVSRNTVICNGEVESSLYGIKLTQVVTSLTNQLEFDDAPSIDNIWAVAVYENTVEGFCYGLNASHRSEAIYGLSSIDSLVEMDLVNNEVVDCESWGVVAYIFSNTTQYSYGLLESDPSINLITSILIQGNLVSLENGVMGMDIDNGIYGGISCLTDHINEQGNLDVLDNEVTGSATGVGIFVYSKPSSELFFTIARNTIDNFSTGIEVDNSEVMIEDNTITNIAYSGINLFQSTGSILDNDIDSQYRGVDVTYSSDIVISGNTVLNTLNAGTGFGIYMDFGENVTISDCTISLFGYGVYLVYVDASTIQGNRLEVLGYHGAYAFDCDGLIIANNSIASTLVDGIYLEYCDLVEIVGNEIYEVGNDGLYLTECDDLVFADNIVHDALDDGLEMRSCYDAVLYNNIIYDCVDYGVYTSSGSMKWIVDEVAEVRNCPVYFGGDVVVVNHGMLTLDSVNGFVLFGDAHDGVPALTVEEGGQLEAVNSELGLDESVGALPFKITPWLFKVFGEIDMEDCVVFGAYQLYCAPTSTVVIHSSVIKYGWLNGVYVDNCSPVIAGTNITDNDGDGVYITGEEAEPDIKNCLISENERGIYAYGGSLGKVIDNLIFYNQMAGIYVESVIGQIHDNILLFNQREIFILESTVTLRDNQIGYSILIEIMSEYWPLFVEMEYPGMLQFSFEPEDILSMMTNHIGVYAEDSTVDARDNYYGMLSYAVYIVDSELLFMDSVEMSSLVIPYMSDYEVSLPIIVSDGIFASGSTLVIEGSYIEVMDDAVFLESSEAEIGDSELISGDLDIYAVGGTTANVYSTSLDSVKVEDSSVVSVFAVLTVYTVDMEGNPMEGIPVTVSSSDGSVVAEGNSTAEGEFIATVLAAQYTSAGENTTINPYMVSAAFQNGWTNETVDVDGPTEVTLMEPDSRPQYSESNVLAMAVIAGILVFIGLLTIAARP